MPVCKRRSSRNSSANTEHIFRIPIHVHIATLQKLLSIFPYICLFFWRYVVCIMYYYTSVENPFRNSFPVLGWHKGKFFLSYFSNFFCHLFNSKTTYEPKMNLYEFRSIHNNNNLLPIRILLTLLKLMFSSMHFFPECFPLSPTSVMCMWCCSHNEMCVIPHTNKENISVQFIP